MGDDRADARGLRTPASTGKRVARHAAEHSLSQPYTGRRVARPVLIPAPTLERVIVPEAAAPYVGRRIARVVPEPPAAQVDEVVQTVPMAAPPAPPVLRPAPIEMFDWGADPLGLDRLVTAKPAPLAAPILVEPVHLGPIVLPPAVFEPERPEPTVSLAPTVDTIHVPLAEPTPEPVLERVVEPVTVPVTVPVTEPLVSPVLEPYGGRRIALPTAPVPIATLTETLEPIPSPAEPTPSPAEPAVDVTPPAPPADRRSVDRRSPRRRVPSMPLIAGVAVLALSAGGALRAVNPNFAGSADAHRLAPASAMSGSSAIGSANLLGGRSTVLSRNSDRLQATVDAKAKKRDAALSAFAAQAQKQAADIKLHQWVLPVAAAAYHLTARFGDYSSLWAHFHTGLDFAAPTGTPIMAVAGGTITEVGYSGAYGNRTVETLPDGTELWYCHQNAFGTSVGATVTPGEVIGYVGSTGNVTGPHLHLEVHPGGGDPVDPFTALQVHGLNP